MFPAFILVGLALFPWNECSRCLCPPDQVTGGLQAPVRRTRHLSHHRPKGGQRFRGFRTRMDEFPPRIIDHPSDLAVPRNHPGTLRCRAEGNPEPVIAWYRNGEYVETNKDDSNSHRTLLPDWSLFFYRLNLRKGSSDEGVYTCVAQNRLGKATSRNASLYIEALRDEFRLEPSDVVVAVGEQAVMECLPPKGHPDPVVMWKKDGVPINENDGHYVVSNGKLVIPRAQKSDAGVFVCVASNKVGQRESKGARFSVLEKPLITRRPSSAIVKPGSTVQFECGTHGDPLPVVSWQKEQGELPLGRYEVSSQNTLQIYYVTPGDSGRYTCSAVNQAGAASVTTTLTVQDDLDTGQREREKQKETLINVRIFLENVTALSSSSSVYLHWKVMSPSPRVEGYAIFYRSMLPASADWMEWMLPKAGERSAVVPTLKRGYKYEFKVRPYIGKSYGPESNVKHLRIPEEVPSAAPQSVNVAIVERGNGTVVVSWEAPPHSTHNGIIKGYKVWCIANKTQHSTNWTVDGGTHSVEIPTLASGVEYVIQVAAVNGAGVGVQSLPKYLYIEPEVDLSALVPPPHVPTLDQLLEVIRQPVFIASTGVVIWIVLMIFAVAVCQRRTKPSKLKRKRSLRDELFRIASEDMIIKHRMNLGESPWLSNSWKSNPGSKQLRGSTSSSSQPLWAETKENPGFQKSTLTFDRKRQCSRGQSVPVVPDTSLYGTLYVDLSGSNMKTFGRHVPPTSFTQNSKVAVPPGHPDQSPLPSFKNINLNNVSCSEGEEKLPWKPRLSAQTNTTDPWNRTNKKELQTAHSTPFISGSSHFQRNGSILGVRALGAHQSNRGNNSTGMKTFSSPKIVHYSASVKLIDVLPPPPPPVLPEEDTQSQGMPEGSTKSTKLTIDSGPPQADVNTPCVMEPPDKEKPSYPTLSYSRLSTASLSLSMNEDGINLLTSEEVAKYLELSEEEDGEEGNMRHLIGSSSSSISRPFSPPHTYGYICGPMPSDLETDPTGEDDDLEMEESYGNSRQFFRKYCQTPTSSLSECDSSMANGWGSVSEDNFTSARSSMVSSSDGSFLMDAHFAQALAVAVDSFCFGLAQVESEKEYTDFSSSASPLASVHKSRESPEGPRITTRKEEAQPLPVLEWTADWLEQMEARYTQKRRGKPSTQTLPDKDRAGQSKEWAHQQQPNQLSHDGYNSTSVHQTEPEVSTARGPFAAAGDMNFAIRKDVDRTQATKPPTDTSRLTVVKV